MEPHTQLEAIDEQFNNDIQDHDDRDNDDERGTFYALMNRRGWGDRLKGGLLPVYRLAELENRNFVVGKAPPGTFRVFCLDETRTCACIMKHVNDGFPPGDVEFTLNSDCAPQILRHPRYAVNYSTFDERAAYLNIYPQLAALPVIEADAALHIRTGHFSDKKTRDSARQKPGEVLPKYVECIERLRQWGYLNENSTIFASSDDERAIKWLQARVPNIVANDGVIGHNELTAEFSTEMEHRLMSDFEAIRRARYVMLTAPSGFSLVAYRLRKHSSALALDGSTCLPPTSFRVHIPFADY